MENTSATAKNRRGLQITFALTFAYFLVEVAGGGATILEYVNAGLIDEFSIALSPVLFGSGIRLFEGVDAGRVALEPVRAEPTQRATHLTYAVRER